MRPVASCRHVARNNSSRLKLPYCPTCPGSQGSSLATLSSAFLSSCGSVQLVCSVLGLHLSADFGDGKRDVGRFSVL